MLPLHATLLRPVPRGPITIVGSPTEAATGSGGANFTLTLPTGLIENDVVYVFIGLPRNAGGGAPAGWTVVSTVDTGTTIRTQLLRKTMGQTPDTTILITGTANGNDGEVAIAIALRGVDINNPEDQTITTATATSTNPDGPSITTLTDKAWVISFAASKVNDTTVTVPTDYLNQVDINSNQINDMTVAGATKEVAVAAAEDPAAWGTWTSAEWITWTVAVRPARL